MNHLEELSGKAYTQYVWTHCICFCLIFPLQIIISVPVAEKTLDIYTFQNAYSFLMVIAFAFVALLIRRITLIKRESQASIKECLKDECLRDMITGIVFITSVEIIFYLIFFVLWTSR